MESLDLLKKLVSISSVYPNEQKVGKFIEDYLHKLNFKVTRVPTEENRFNIVGTNGESDRYLGLYGHMDTVEPASDYIREPFQVEIENDIARGLGVCDMKSGLVTILKTAEYASKKQIPLKVIFGVDEENISQGAHDLVTSGLLNDLHFLIVAESGQIEDYNQDLSACYGRKGRIVFNIEVKGKIAHAAESEKGINAVEKAAELIQAIQTISFPKHSNLGKTNIVFQTIHADSGAFSIPDKCIITCSLLTTPNVSSTEFIEKVKTLAREKNIEITIQTAKRKTPYGESFEIDRNNEFLKKIEKEVLSGYNVSPLYTPSVADENVFANRLEIPVLSLGVIGGGDHTKDEWMKISSLNTLQNVYKSIIELVQ